MKRSAVKRFSVPTYLSCRRRSCFLFYKTTCFRETSSIETYAAGLVDVLECALNYDIAAQNDTAHDTPHSKIASDLLSCLFLVSGFSAVYILIV